MIAEPQRGTAHNGQANTSPAAHEVHVCVAAGCMSMQSDAIKTALENGAKERGCKV